jgi:hypothetical protein
MSSLNTKAFEESVNIMEEVYPGYKDKLSSLYNAHQFRHMVMLMKKFIDDNGGFEKLAVFYNNADEVKKDTVRNTFLKAFKPDTAFEDQVLLLDNIAKIKNLGTLTQLLGEIKDNVIMASVGSGLRTIEEWRTFIRYEHEAGNEIRLGILDILEKQQELTTNFSVNKNSQIEIPKDLDSSEARQIFCKAKDKGLFIDNYKWKKSKALLAYFADKTSEHLGLSKSEQDGRPKTNWQPFETLFHESGLADAKNTYTNKTGKLPIDYKIVDSIFD